MNKEFPFLNITVRSMLIDSARRKIPLSYGKIMAKIELDHKDTDDRRKFSTILENISRYEHSRYKRPMLSAQIMYEGLKDIGGKFYWLASQLGYGPQNKLQKDMFEYEMQKRCFDFWSNDFIHQKFKDDIPEINVAGSDCLIKIAPPEGMIEVPNQAFLFSGVQSDWIAVTIENMQLGAGGEYFVIEYEKEILKHIGKPELAAKVTKVIDGKGYDILSWTADEKKKFIEVKTTAGSKERPFPISVNEVAFSRAHPHQYHVYRLFNFIADKPPIKFIEYAGSLDSWFHLQPTLFKAWQKKQN